ncbi:MAG: glycosyltransferase family 39 protein [Bacteroidetes bacterium]|nr:glycosyltransferase family 39 protein [Bacteroidota bacterium]
MGIRKKIFLLILWSTAIRCLLAFFLEFGNDEVYYWTYAQHLQWNYFDHPPMVALLVRLGTLNLLLHNELFVRAGSIVCAAINTWLIFLIAKKIKDEKAGWYAALLYTSSFYCSIIAGTFILPDSPQVLFWMLSILLMIKIIDATESPVTQSKLLLLLGAVIGLCIMSKVHAVFLWFGFGLYILLYDRKFFTYPALYISVVITAVIISPIIIWNVHNHFITYSFHESRVGFFDKKLDWDSFLQQLIGSIAYNNPVNFFLYVIGVAGILRYKNFVPKNYRRLLLLLGFPLILVLLVMSLFNETLPHWSGPAYISLLILTAIYFSAKNINSSKTPGGILAANYLLLFVAIAGIIVIRYLPFQLGNKQERILGDSDVTLDMSGWKDFSGKFYALYNADVKQGLMKENAFIISDKWFPAANLDYYIANPFHLNFFAAGKLVDIHNYAWLNKTRTPLKKGDDAYFIFPTNYYGAPKKNLLDHFEKTDSAVIIPQFRSGVHVRNFVIVRLHDYKGGLPEDGIIGSTN